MSRRVDLSMQPRRSLEYAASQSTRRTSKRNSQRSLPIMNTSKLSFPRRPILEDGQIASKAPFSKAAPTLAVPSWVSYSRCSNNLLYVPSSLATISKQGTAIDFLLGHQLHPVLRRRLFHVSWHYCQPLPHSTDHNIGQCVLNTNLFLHCGKVRPQEHPHCRRQLHVRRSIYRWHHWGNFRQECKY